MENDLVLEHPVCALATPFASSALAIIRVAGKESVYKLSTLCKRSERLLSCVANYTALYELIDPTDKTVLDTAMITPYYAPHSYTGQEGADISIHGSLAGIQRMLNALYKSGFSQAEPGEFTKRAFLNGKLDLTQSEAIHDVIQAHNTANHIEALERLGGTVFNYIDKIKQCLLRLVATCSVSLDYPEDEIQENTDINSEDIEQALSMLKIMLAGYDFAQIRKNSTHIVLAGRTNAGKSSLFNALLKEDRAIVSDLHGTTRDFLKTELTLKDIPVTIYDTAGIYDTVDTNIPSAISFVEQESIRRSKDLLANANIILYVFDGFDGWHPYDTQILEQLGYGNSDNDVDKKKARVLIVCNKMDLVKNSIDETMIPQDILQHSLVQDNIIYLSVKEYRNIMDLQHALYECIIADIEIPEKEVPLISSLRQKLALEKSKDALEEVRKGLKNNVPLDMISLDLDIAMAELGTITGEVVSEDVLEAIFSNFCVGK